MFCDWFPGQPGIGGRAARPWVGLSQLPSVEKVLGPGDLGHTGSTISTLCQLEQHTSAL